MSSLKKGKRQNSALAGDYFPSQTDAYEYICGIEGSQQQNGSINHTAHIHRYEKTLFPSVTTSIIMFLFKVFGAMEELDGIEVFLPVPVQFERSVATATTLPQINWRCYGGHCDSSTSGKMQTCYKGAVCFCGFVFLNVEKNIKM